MYQPMRASACWATRITNTAGALPSPERVSGLAALFLPRLAAAVECVLRFCQAGSVLPCVPAPGSAEMA
jgi:hypothetical protein